jgi:putative transposase
MRLLSFITFSCYHRYKNLGTATAREVFEQSLEAMRLRYDFVVSGYVVMPDHVHLLINEPPSILVAQFLKAFKQITSRKLRGPREKFWQERYFDCNIRGEDARSEVIRYIHRNPVKRGLVASPGEYPWSSFNHYVTGIRGVVEIESEWTARLRGPLIAKKLR